MNLAVLQQGKRARVGGGGSRVAALCATLMHHEYIFDIRRFNVFIHKRRAGEASVCAIELTRRYAFGPVECCVPSGVGGHGYMPIQSVADGATDGGAGADDVARAGSGEQVRRVRV